MVSLIVYPRFWVAALALFVVASSLSRAETTWQFGSGPGRHGDGGFVRGNTSSTNGKWTVEDNALRFTNRFAGGGSDHNNYTEAAAVIDLREQGHRPGRDFTISVLMEARGISDWNRFGLLALAPDMREHAYQDDGFYGALFIMGRSGQRMVVAEDFAGARASASLDLPGAIRNGIHRLTLSGMYDDEGRLSLRFDVAQKDGDGAWTVVSRPLSNPLDNPYFGFGGRFKAYAGHQPVLDFREFRYEPRAKRPPEFDRDPIMFTGRWEHGGREHLYRVTVRQAFHSFGPLPTVVYFRNLPVPRVGTDSDERIISDLLDDGNVVIELDCRGLSAEEPDLQQALAAFNSGLIDRVVRLTEAVITPDENFLYWVPEGHRLARNVPFWNIERHGAHGSMERIMEVFNRDITRRAGVDPIDSPDQLHGPNGVALDFNLYLDLVYPSGTPDQRVPVIAHFATQCRMARGFREHRAAYPITWVTSGYALAYVDHVYNPLARARYYGYFDAYSLQTWNGVAAGSAAIRHLRAHADRYNLNGRVGVLGHSKSSYTVMRLADPNHPRQPEHATFEGFPSGSPEPQPWDGHSSRVEVAYVSMGLGVRWTQYTTPDVVPLIVAVGRHDNFNYWNVTPAQVAKAEELDLNHLAIWMAELGHSYPLGRDHATGIDRTHLVRRFFDQHLYPHGDDSLAVLAVTPPDGAVGVPDDGSIPVFGVEEENQFPNNLRGLPIRQPVTVRFARSVEPDSLLAGGLRLWVVETGETVKGTWKASLGNTRFTFTPDQPLAHQTTYAVEVEAGVHDTNGRALPHSHRQLFTTGG